MSEVTIIGVGGGSCSGKTTFSKHLLEHFGTNICQVIWQDDYYIDQSHRFDKDGGAVNFDHPSAIDFDLLHDHLNELKNNRVIQCPTYDFATHTRTGVTKEVTPHPIILVDGILIFHQENLRNTFDYRYYISAPEDVRFERRLKRDTTERGRTAEGVHDQFYKQVAPMHNQFVSPTKEFAHRVITQETFSQEESQVIKELERKVQQTI